TIDFQPLKGANIPAQGNALGKNKAQGNALGKNKAQGNALGKNQNRFLRRCPRLICQPLSGVYKLIYHRFSAPERGKHTSPGQRPGFFSQFA
ncbi:MAG: hypothetical protein DRR19_27660, partial [Candidatus Parabeggiatoa sp. nov. 1]